MFECRGLRSALVAVSCAAVLFAGLPNSAPANALPLESAGGAVPPELVGLTLDGADVSLRFLEPESFGSGSKTGFVAACVSASSPTLTASGTGSPLVVAGLEAGVPYDCSVVTQTTAGDSPSSIALRVVPGLGTVPDPPVVEQVHRRNGALVLLVSLPSDGGQPIGRYTARCVRETVALGLAETYGFGTPDYWAMMAQEGVVATSTETTLVVKRLLNNNRYQCSVAASNSVGRGAFGPVVTDGPSSAPPGTFDRPTEFTCPSGVPTDPIVASNLAGDTALMWGCAARVTHGAYMVSDLDGRRSWVLTANPTNYCDQWERLLEEEQKRRGEGPRGYGRCRVQSVDLYPGERNGIETPFPNGQIFISVRRSGGGYSAPMLVADDVPLAYWVNPSISEEPRRRPVRNPYEPPYVVPSSPAALDAYCTPGFAIRAVYPTRVNPYNCGEEVTDAANGLWFAPDGTVIVGFHRVAEVEIARVDATGSVTTLGTGVTSAPRGTPGESVQPKVLHWVSNASGDTLIGLGAASLGVEHFGWILKPNGSVRSLSDVPAMVAPYVLTDRREVVTYAGPYVFRLGIDDTAWQTEVLSEPIPDGAVINPVNGEISWLREKSRRPVEGGFIISYEVVSYLDGAWSFTEVGMSCSPGENCQLLGYHYLRKGLGDMSYVRDGTLLFAWQRVIPGRMCARAGSQSRGREMLVSIRRPGWRRLVTVPIASYAPPCWLYWGSWIVEVVEKWANRYGPSFSQLNDGSIVVEWSEHRFVDGTLLEAEELELLVEPSGALGPMSDGTAGLDHFRSRSATKPLRISNGAGFAVFTEVTGKGELLYTSRNPRTRRIAAKTTNGSVFRAATPGAVGSLVSLAADSSVRVSWAPPSRNGGALVTSYTVQRSTDGKRWYTISQGSSATSFEVKGLQNGRRYLFRVAAVNRMGTGRWTIRTARPRAPLPSVNPSQD